MKKFCVYRFLDGKGIFTDNCILVGVEYGKSIEDVTDKLIETVNEDMANMDKYQTGYTFAAFAPEKRIAHKSKGTQQCAYTIGAIAYPDFFGENDLLEYGVIEMAAPPAV